MNCKIIVTYNFDTDFEIYSYFTVREAKKFFDLRKARLKLDLLAFQADTVTLEKGGSAIVEKKILLENSTKIFAFFGAGNGEICVYKAHKI